MSKNERMGLGNKLKGLSVYDSLLGTESAPDSPYQLLPLSELHPNPDQARHHFDTAAIYELAASIREHGVIQPIVVRPRAQGGYSIVAGERRYRASIHAELTEIPAIIRSFESNDDVLEITAIENLQREDLTLYETIQALIVMQERSNLSGRDLAVRLGKPRTWVLERLKIGNNPEIMAKVKDGLIGFRDARDSTVKEKTTKKIETGPQWATDSEETVAKEWAVSQDQNGPQWATSNGEWAPLSEYGEQVIAEDLKVKTLEDDYRELIPILYNLTKRDCKKEDAIFYLQKIVETANNLISELDK